MVKCVNGRQRAYYVRVRTPAPQPRDTVRKVCISVCGVKFFVKAHFTIRRILIGNRAVSGFYRGRRDVRDPARDGQHGHPRGP